MVDVSDKPQIFREIYAIGAVVSQPPNSHFVPSFSKQSFSYIIEPGT